MSSTSNMSIAGPQWSSQPWVWIVIPIGLVVVLGASGFALHSCRRRRRHYKNSQILADPVASMALERDLWEMGDRGSRGGDASSAGNDSGRPRGDAAAGRRSQQQSESTGSGSRGGWSARPLNRWAWANNANVIRAAEEGLNELGEAPPPYPGRGSAHNKPDGDGRTDGAAATATTTTMATGELATVAESVAEPQPGHTHTRVTAITGPPPTSPPLYRTDMSASENGTRGPSRPIIAQPATAVLSGRDQPPPFESP